MDNLFVVSLILIFALGILIGVFFNSSGFGGLTGAAVSAGNKTTSGDYSYTKAVCNATSCIDVVVNCSNGKITETKQIGNFSDFGSSWNDTRGNKNLSCS